ncbi:MAG: MarR family winged helix-turn-helix transcriptional regulator [Candidatus Aphodocola sp.]
MSKRKIPFEIKMLDNMLNRKICENVKKEGIFNISHVQADILGYLYRNKNRIIYQNEVEKEIGARRSTISGILRTMEKNGLIIKKDSLDDARKKEISLTDKSIKKHDELEKKVVIFEKELLKGISCEEKEIFFKVIDKLKDNLR